jgi:hypothetical protein
MNIDEFQYAQQISKIHNVDFETAKTRAKANADVFNLITADGRSDRFIKECVLRDIDPWDCTISQEQGVNDKLDKDNTIKNTAS